MKTARDHDTEYGTHAKRGAYRNIAAQPCKRLLYNVQANTQPGYIVTTAEEHFKYVVEVLLFFFFSVFFFFFLCLFVGFGFLLIFYRIGNKVVQYNRKPEGIIFKYAWLVNR